MVRARTCTGYRPDPMIERPEGAPGGGPLARWWPWLVGLGGSAIALGPALGPGSLLNLDLVLTPHRPVPPGLWGLGPALPQRIPSGLPQALLDPLIGAPLAGKAVLVLTLVVAFVGATRLCVDAVPIARIGAGLLYALGPFAVTRAADGHLNVLVLLAVLPFALPVLVHPAESLPRTYLWALAMSLAGAPGGATVAVIVAVGLIADRGRRLLPVSGLVLLSCLIWLAPSVSVLAAGAGVSGAGKFATVVDGPTGLGRLLLGGGFWRGDDLGAAGPGVLLLAVAMLGLAVVGHQDLPERLRGRLLATGLVGLALALASAVPVVRDGYRWFTDLPVGAPFRESQRSLCLWLAWLAPAAALGATRVARTLHRRARADDRWFLHGASTAVPWSMAVGVVLLAAPGWWGADGSLRPVKFPAGWAEVGRRIDAQPGTVLALPWKEYLDVSFAGGRRVLNPLPDYLGGDVLSSYDPEFDLAHTSQEQVDRRADQVDRSLPSLLAGHRSSDRFVDLGVRWVVLLHESTPLERGAPPLATARSTWDRYRGSLSSDAGMRLAYVDPSIELWQVRGWRGPVHTSTGRSLRMTGPLPIVRTTSAGAATWNKAGAPGWMRGARPVPVTADGLLALPGGGGIIWFWPGIVVLAVDGLVIVAAVLAWRRGHSTTRNPPAGMNG